MASPVLFGMASPVLACVLLLLPLWHELAVAQSPACAQVLAGGKTNACILETLASNPLRVVFLDKQYVTSNLPARNKAAALGIPYSCDNKNALPEWSAAPLLTLPASRPPLAHPSRSPTFEGPNLFASLTDPPLLAASSQRTGTAAGWASLWPVFSQTLGSR